MIARLSLVAACLLAGLSDDALAQSGDSRTAKALFEEGIEHADAGRDADALAAFKRAYEQDPHFAVLYNIARIELRLGDEEAALETLRQYLTTGRDRVPPERRQWAERTIQRLTRISAAEPVKPATPAKLAPKAAKLKVDCPWFDFTLAVDAKPIARTPFNGTLVLPARTYRVQFLREGYLASAIPVKLSADELGEISCRPIPDKPIPPAVRARLSLQVEPASATVSLDGLPIRSGAFVPAGRHLLQVDATDHEPETLSVALVPNEHRSISVRLKPIPAPEPTVGADERPYRNAGALIGTTGLVTAASGLAVFIWNDQRYRQWREDDRELRAPGASGEANYENRVSEHNALLDSIHRYDTATWITLGIGGVLSAAGGILYFWRQPSSSDALALTSHGAAWQAVW